MRYIIIIAALLVMALPSCRMMKTVSREVRDSIVLKTHDTTIVRYVTNSRDSVVIRDSVITIKAGHTGFTLPVNSTTDTIIKKGHITLRRTVNNGIEHIDCNSDSLTLVVNNLTYRYKEVARERDSIKSNLSSSDKTHTEVTVKQVQKSWFGRLWDNVKNIFSWFGLICLVVIIVWIVKKFFFR